jgi:glycogen debranching enzyme
LYHGGWLCFEEVALLEGSVSEVSPGAYVVSDGRGDVDGSVGRGLFYRDVRHLSEFRLKIDGESPVSLASRTRGLEAKFVLAVGDSGSVGVTRRRSLGGGMNEEILLTNEARETIQTRVELGCAADFRDVFEVRGYRRAVERGEISEEVGDGYLRFAYRRDGFRRGTVVWVSGEGVEPLVEPGRISFGVRLEPGEERAVRVSVVLEEGDEEVRWRRPAPLYGEAPALETDWEVLRRSWERSVEDLEALSFDAGDGLLVPAAGAPWFMALFGRDALITGYQTMILSPEPAKNTLRALAGYQATQRDDFRDAEPGKIPHEIRHGELAFFGEIPHSPYYGTADATPLFLILLNEVWRWSGDVGFVRELEGPARRALDWIFHHADRTWGYVAYATRSPTGLQNHGWRDRTNSMLFRDATRAEEPVASCEVQGYVYDAFVRSAQLAEQAWGDTSLALRLRAAAGDLKEHFDGDFWMEDRGYYALALDGAGRRVDSLGSSAGHLLWSGIVSEERARAVADRLMSEELFSGWGVRTMAEGEGGYDAGSYHNGSVWPHDNALIACGLRRYGLLDEVNRISTAILQAAVHFDYRLPEVFAGYPRGEVNEPVELPRSCSPQAWAAGTVLLLVRAMLGVEPEGTQRSSSSAVYKALPSCYFWPRT